MATRVCRRRVRWSLAAILLASPVSADVIDRVLAVVGTQLITLSDAAAAIELGLVASRGPGDPVAVALPELIDRRLMLIEVDRYLSPEPPAEAVEARLDEVRARFTSEQAWVDTLSRVGMTVARLRGRLQDDLRIQTYLDQRFAPAQPSPAEVAAYYQSHADEFTRDGSLLPVAEVGAAIRDRILVLRRERLIADWLRDLRRRTDVIVLYWPAK